MNLKLPECVESGNIVDCADYDLVSALSVNMPEITREIKERACQKGSTNCLVWRFLTEKGFEEFDALKGLISTCRKANKTQEGNSLFVLPESYEDMSIGEATHRFIEVRTLLYRAGLLVKSREELARMALKGAFGGYAKLCRNWLLDEIDRQKAAKSDIQLPKLSLDAPVASDEDGFEITLGDTLGTNGDPCGIFNASRELFLASLKRNHTKLTELLGKKAVETLFLMLRAEVCGASWKDIKARRVLSVMGAFNLKKRAAEIRIKALMDKLEELAFERNEVAVTILDELRLENVRKLLLDSE